AYKRQQKEYKKRINQIETSNTWKLGNLLKPFSSIWNKLFKQSVYDKERIAHLEKEVMKQHEKIERLETELAPLRLLDEQITSFSITQQMRSLKNEGKLLEEINSLVNEKNRITENLREALTYTARLYMNEDEVTRKAIYEQILSGLAIEEIPEFMIRAGLSESPISLRHSSSFRVSLSTRMRQQQLNSTLPEWLLDDKQTAYDFVEQFNTNVPKLDKT